MEKCKGFYIPISELMCIRVCMSILTYLMCIDVHTHFMYALVIVHILYVCMCMYKKALTSSGTFL